MVFALLVLYTGSIAFEQLTDFMPDPQLMTRLGVFLESLSSSMLMPILTMYLLYLCGESWRTSLLRFLKNKEQIMDLLSLPTGWYARGYKSGKPSPEILEKMRTVYENATADYPDVLKVKEVCAITGYGESTVIKRCKKNAIRYFLIRQKYKEIPHNTAAHLAAPFPTSDTCRFLDYQSR